MRFEGVIATLFSELLAESPFVNDRIVWGAVGLEYGRSDETG